ncbi:TPA: hypothetical protein ACWP0T_004657 [Escherichia coli]
MKLILPFPPSVNTYWRHPNKGAFAGKSLISAAGRKFQSAACAAIVEQLRRLPKPTSAPASVEIVLFPPDNQHAKQQIALESQRKHIKNHWTMTKAGSDSGFNISQECN